MLHEPLKALRVNHVDQITDLNPQGSVSECFRVNVSTHARGELIIEIQFLFLENLVQPRYRDSMRPLEVTHRRVPACLNDSNHRLIILMEMQNGLVREKSPPKCETGKAAVPQGKIGGNHFGFRR